ncbi:helix-turn-helix domain-containing protein [Halolamina salina]|uniref:Helix-turn-helix domain-containing protein n=1 Tax=Halolamina salina TaxID=1220023 RepID=A0ABD6BAW7_9EURY
MVIPTGEEIRDVRKERGMTQSELADEAGVSQPLIARIENGDVDPTLESVHCIVTALNEAQLPIDAKDISVMLPGALRDARKGTGYTQGGLADAADVSQPLISRIENDDVNPRASTLRAIFEELDIDEREDDAGSDSEEEQDILAQLNAEFKEF